MFFNLNIRPYNGHQQNNFPFSFLNVHMDGAADIFLFLLNCTKRYIFQCGFNEVCKLDNEL